MNDENPTAEQDMDQTTGASVSESPGPVDPPKDEDGSANQPAETPEDEQGDDEDADASCETPEDEQGDEDADASEPRTLSEVLGQARAARKLGDVQQAQKIGG